MSNKKQYGIAAAILGSCCAAVAVFMYYSFFSAPDQDYAPLQTELTEPSTDMVVYVSGAVEAPGIYRLPAGSRIGDAVRAAENLLPYADAETANMAAKLTDGDHVRVGFAWQQPEERLGIRLVNINTADAVELQRIPSVGEATAERILEYRRERGLFRSPADVMNVKGIGEGKYRQMRKHITI
ncbi:MAG: ComEA family DNA-binding protein [Veillonellaceae bacterium]|nr:ComEA family DNA-binding protein [Veillonellaceae bacterium]